jgi:hypothetical protein
MQRWNWFMSADVQGKWLSNNGHAEVDWRGNSFTATLRIGSDSRTEVYHVVTGEIDDENYIRAEIVSPNRDMEPFPLPGVLFRGGNLEGVDSLTALLTDGTTVLGLTYGPRSNERNM